jgi:hypothetical protein
MKTLIIGKGQVGSALYEVVRDHHETFIKDVEDLDLEGVQVLHICYPEHEGFIETTSRYIEKYKPRLTIINSSVSVGTCSRMSYSVIYSPVRGRHPKLSSDLKIYTKFVFSKNPGDQELAARYFETCGLSVYTGEDPLAGELIKLLSNIHMGLEIAWRQEVDRILEKFSVDSFVYEEWERTYRNGYKLSGDEHLMRPSMKPDPIGGHCILPCTEILKKDFPSKIFDFILESNEKAKGDENAIASISA